MPEQKGFKQLLLRLPTRALCLVLLALVALMALYAILYSPTGAVEDLWKWDTTLNQFVFNADGYASDIFTVDPATGASVLNTMNVGIIAGALVGALVLAWLIGFLPKKLPVWIFPVIGGAVAFLFVTGLQLKPAGEGATMASWIADYWTNSPNYTFTADPKYIEMVNNAPYDMGYLLFLFPVMYIGALVFGVDTVNGGYVAFNNLIWLQWVNVALLAIAVYMLLRAANRLFGKTAAQVAGLLSVAFLPLAMFSVALTSEIPALFFASIAIERTVVYLKNEKKLEDRSIVRFKKNGRLFNALIVSLCMALAIIIKANYVVLGVVMVVVYLLDLLRNFRLKNMLPLIVIIALIAVHFLGMYPAAMISNSIFGNYYAPASNTTASDLTNSLTGGATEQVTALQNSNTTALFNSFLPQWLDPTFGLTDGILSHLNADGLYIEESAIGPLPLYLFYLGGEVDPVTNAIIPSAYLAVTICNVEMNIIYVFAIFGLLVCVFRASVERLILPLYVIGGILFHMIMGINPISGIPYMLALIALAGYGLASVAGLFHGKSRRDDPLSKHFAKNRGKKKKHRDGEIETARG